MMSKLLITLLLTFLSSSLFSENSNNKLEKDNQKNLSIDYSYVFPLRHGVFFYLNLIEKIQTLKDPKLFEIEKMLNNVQCQNNNQVLDCRINKEFIDQVNFYNHLLYESFNKNPSIKHRYFSMSFTESELKKLFELTAIGKMAVAYWLKKKEFPKTLILDNISYIESLDHEAKEESDRLIILKMRILGIL